MRDGGRSLALHKKANDSDPAARTCGSCFACDNRYGVCPDNAVIKLDPTGSYA